MTRLIWAFVLTSMGSAVAEEAARAPQVVSRVDWAAGRVILDVSIPVDAADPRARFRGEDRVESMVPDLFLGAVGGIVLDSWYTVFELLKEDPRLLLPLRQLSEAGQMEPTRLSPDLRSVHVRRTFPLFGPGGLAEALVVHRAAFALPRILGLTPTRRFTGLVIYAAEPLPAHGLGEDRLAQPALFPRIYDEEMNLLLSREMVEPGRLRQWGVAAYSSDTNLRRHTARIGVDPLAVAARGVFGRNATDLMIPVEDARRLLADEDNRRFLAEGRILIITASSDGALGGR